MSDFYKDKRIAITGAAGTVGQALSQQLLDLGAEEVIALDNNENELFFMAETHRQNPRFHSYLCDIRQRTSLSQFFEGADRVIHAAALKHVPSCERSPSEAVETNIHGTQNVIQAAIDVGVSKVIFTSTDKAVNPTTVMGTSKLMSERLITSASALCRSHQKTVFASSRFGNVLGSSGSVVPLFIRQIRDGGPVTLTHDDMTRFVMNIGEASRLVLRALELFKSGEVFVNKMPVIRIRDLAATMIHRLAPIFDRDPAEIQVVAVGVRPGEKLYEELTTEEEVSRTVETDEFMIVLPAFRNRFRRFEYEYGLPQTQATSTYNSAIEPCGDDATVLSLLLADGVLPPDLQKELSSRVSSHAAGAT